MPRIVYTGIPVAHVDFREFDVITPHPTAARAVGAPYRSLHGLARDVALAHGYTIARPVIARRMLVMAVAQAAGDDQAKINDAGALATRLLLPLQTAMRADIDPAQLWEFGSERVKELAAVMVAYRELLRREKLLDDAELLQFASTLELTQRRLYLHGYFRARPEEIAFINAVAGEGSVTVLPEREGSMWAANARARQMLEAHDWTSQEVDAAATVGSSLAARFRGETAVIDEPQVSAITYADIDAEVRGALGRVKSLLLSGASPTDIVLVARDARQYGPAVAAVADEYQVPVRRNYRLTLAETRIGGWVTDLLEAARNDVAFEPTVRLVAHPLGSGIGAANWRDAREKHTAGVAEWSKIAPALAALAWPDRDIRTEWVKRFLDALRSFNVRQLCGENVRDRLAFDLLTSELADEFHGNETLERGQFADELASILSLLTVPVEPGAGGVELHDPQTISGARNEHLFILGAADGILPGPAEDNPVVDFNERKQLARHGVEFEHAADIARWEELGFHFLLESGTKSIHLSYPQMLDGQVRLPSAYLNRLGLQPESAPADAPEVFSESELRRSGLIGDAFGDAVLTAARHARAVELARETSPVYDQYDGVTGIADTANRMWSASQFLKLGQCPFRWFAEKALRVQPVTEPELGLAPDVRGKLYHKALELAMDKPPEGADLRTWALHNIMRCFDEAAKDPEVALPSLPAWEAQRLEHLDVLRAAIRSEDFLTPDSRVVGQEVKFVTQWHGLRVMGYIDRVDRSPEGLIFIDYKTGGKPNGIKDQYGQLKQDIQLPIYIEAAAPALYPGQAVASGYYFSIRQARSLADVGPEAVPELAEFAASVRRRLATGHFPVEPDAKQEACKFCDFEMVCRKGHRLNRKTA